MAALMALIVWPKSLALLYSKQLRQEDLPELETWGHARPRARSSFFVDADVTIHADTIAQIAFLFTENKTLAAAIGSYDDDSGAPNFLSQYKNLFHHYTHQTSREEASTFWGACGAIRRKVFEDVGGFDERYKKPSIEDIELGYRLKQNGYDIRLCKTLYVKHLKRWEPVSLLRAEFFCRALPWTELLLNKDQTVNDLNLKYSARLSVMLVFTVVLLVLVGFWYPASFGMAGLLVLALVSINFSVYQFFIKSAVFGSP